MNWGSLLRAGAGGVIAADESRKDRTRELLIEAQRQRQEQQQETLRQAQTRKYEQDATYDQQDRVVKEAERAKNEVANAAEQSRREQALPIRVRLARELVPEFKDVTQYDDQTLSAYVADEDNWKTIAARQGKSDAPVMGDTRWKEAKMFEAQLGAQYRAPPRTSSGRTAADPSVKDATDRREFMQKRITHWIDANVSSGEAQRRAEAEYKGAEFSAGSVSRPTAPSRPTAGGKPPSALRPASQQDIDGALDANGGDVAKATEYLRKKGLH